MVAMVTRNYVISELPSHRYVALLNTHITVNVIKPVIINNIR